MDHSALMVKIFTALAVNQIFCHGNIFCPDRCICGNVGNLLTGNDKQFSQNEAPSIKTDDEKKSALNILRKYHWDYYLHSAGFSIICPSHNFTSIPKVLYYKPNNAERMSGSTHHMTSVLVLRHGLLKCIKRHDLPTNLQVADFSNNQITHIDNNVLNGLLHLQVLNLQHNSLSRFSLYAGILPLPRLRLKHPVILVKENPIQCSCDLYYIVTQHLGREDSSCLNMKNNSQDEEESNATSTQDQYSNVQITMVPLLFLRHIAIEMVSFCMNPKVSFSQFFTSQEAEFQSFMEDYETREIPPQVNRRRDLYRDYFYFIKNKDDVEKKEADLNKTARAKKYRSWTIDYPLLITMFGWFLMVFVGLSKFIKSNSLDYEMHKDYLLKLDEQENEVVGSIRTPKSKLLREMTIDSGR
uniref:uncharacterized protein LOC120329770 isoform X1 n=1 Tax=Styela clava TaxID=7725 RepID=UPI00193A8B97|nr:uncharacterized protein LOC120329770 isoform X1 [Styela clava]